MPVDVRRQTNDGPRLPRYFPGRFKHTVGFSGREEGRRVERFWAIRVVRAITKGGCRDLFRLCRLFDVRRPKDRRRIAEVVSDGYVSDNAKPLVHRVKTRVGQRRRRAQVRRVHLTGHKVSGRGDGCNGGCFL